jgi:type IV pilus assembly protein PilV
MHQQLSSSSSRRRAAGFTLVEVLVTLLIVSVGMLGLVKMEAAGVSESSVSRTRSLMTFQAESLAGMMRANRAFWTGGTSLSFTVPVSGSDPTYPTGATAANATDATCGTVTASVHCSAGEMAHADLAAWAASFQGSFPYATAGVSCVGNCAAGSTGPKSFDITLSWSERTVSTSRSATGTDAPSSPNVSIVLHVQP